jgi:hypothetical protein
MGWVLGDDYLQLNLPPANAEMGRSRAADFPGNCNRQEDIGVVRWAGLNEVTPLHMNLAKGFITSDSHYLLVGIIENLRWRSVSIHQIREIIS